MANTNHTEIIHKLYAAINSNDVPAAMKLLDPQIIRVEPEGFPSSGTYRGIPEVSAHFTQALSTWAEGACNVERIISEGDKAVVFVHVHVRLKNQTDWIDGRTSDAYAFKDGKITEMRTFLNSEDAIKWAGFKA